MDDLLFGDYYSDIPDYMRGPLVDYVKHHKKPGDFLCSVICNDLRGAVGLADKNNLPIIKLYVMWFENVAPYNCYGSPEIMKKWLNINK